MTIFRCKEISCEHCVSRIDRALTSEKIVHQINLEEKTVSVEGDEAVLAQAVEILDDLGFTAEMLAK